MVALKKVNLVRVSLLMHKQVKKKVVSVHGRVLITMSQFTNNPSIATRMSQTKGIPSVYLSKLIRVVNKA